MYVRHDCQLWNDLRLHKNLVRGVPWILLGDFNVALNMEDCFSGSSSMNSAMCDFKECVEDIEVLDVNCTDLQYTWNQNPKVGNGLLKKLDRIMGNIKFVDSFLGAYAVFQPYRISDHSSAVLKIPNLTVAKPKPFKFYNFLAHKGKFLDLVSMHWLSHLNGHYMFQVVRKLKRLKKPLRKLLTNQGNIHDRVNCLRHELDEVQKALDLNPMDTILRDEEVVYVQAFNEAKLNEERFLKQKAKIKWLEVGDSNSSYFYPSVKNRNQRSCIDAILGSDNVVITEASVTDVSEVSANHMKRDVSNEEIKRAMFDIGDDRAPGPDGYTSTFFKKGWNIVGVDICNAIRDFFSNGQILKEINHTFIALIPKVNTPLKVNDYRLISCCNVIYKCISKIITNRIIDGIKEVVSDNQSAFVPGRRISDNILYTQELMHNYHRNRGPLRGDVESAKVIMDSLEEFKLTLGLVPSIPKSTTYFCDVLTHVKLAILSIMPFFEGALPVKYLGVPLISSRLLNKDCKILVERVRNRIGILLDIQQLIRGFLWCNGKYKHGKAKVAWDNICLLYSGGKTLWDIPLKSDMSWGWHKILHIRDLLLSHRDINREGFHLRTCVADLITNDTWNWPQTWITKAPMLLQVPVPSIVDSYEDTTRWRDSNGTLSDFSIRKAWDVIRPRGDVVLWHRIVWFSHCIPRHAFHLWLVMRNNLKTQDKLRQWDVWLRVRGLAGMDTVSPNLHDIIAWLQPMARNRTTQSIFGKLILVAVSYFIWIERNNRLFKNSRRYPKEVIDIIMVRVHLKFITFRFKNTSMVNQLLARWKMPDSFRIYGS
ncbi:hypothetical protein Tco_0725057 [Tanacetum coccineum]|uniref:Reverse transcriptase zinc-binding domain-containing protein n=1 Tax=Tanacetum coccineum TaxID=301880 RepID=A0ABQ4YCP9_9ASTR